MVSCNSLEGRLNYNRSQTGCILLLKTVKQLIPSAILFLSILNLTTPFSIFAFCASMVF
jgi:hypothetical protein